MTEQEAVIEYYKGMYQECSEGFPDTSSDIVYMEKMAGLETKLGKRMCLAILYLADYNVKLDNEAADELDAEAAAQH